MDEVAPGSVGAVPGDPVLLAELRLVLVDLGGLSQFPETGELQDQDMASTVQWKEPGLKGQKIKYGTTV